MNFVKDFGNFVIIRNYSDSTFLMKKKLKNHDSCHDSCQMTPEI